MAVVSNFSASSSSAKMDDEKDFVLPHLDLRPNGARPGEWSAFCETSAVVHALDSPCRQLHRGDGRVGEAGGGPAPLPLGACRTLCAKLGGQPDPQWGHWS